MQIEMEQTRPHKATKASQKSTSTLSILNRVGSAPDLPLHSSLSASVYSSAKKRNLAKATGPNGAGPHLVAMQRSRLVPLPINIRTGTLLREPGDRRNYANNNHHSAELRESRSTSDLDSLGADPLRQQQLMDEKVLDDYAIASLKQRLSVMEKDAGRDLKQRQALERQVAQLVRENHCVGAEKQQLATKVEQLEKSVLQQKHAFEKLSDRYAAVYSNLQKLTEQQQASSPANHTASVQSVLQALTKENQEFQRKLRVRSDVSVVLRVCVV